MHILYLLTDLNTGGAALPVPELVALMRAEGHTVRVAALLPKDRNACARLDQAGIRWDLLGQGPRDLVPAARALLRLLRDDPPDVIWTSLTRATMYGSFAGVLRGLPVVSWQHNAWLKRGNWLQLRAVQRLTALWVADSRAVRDFAMRALAIPHARIDVWPLFRARAEAPSASRWNGHGRFRIGTLGRLHVDKCYHDLVAAAALIRRIEPVLAARIEFVIGGVGGEEGRLRRQIAEAGLDNVHLPGFIADTATFLAGLHAYAQPSHHEGLCIAAHEAMQAALPVVATRVGEMQYSIVPGATGFLCDVGNVAQLAEAIIAMARDPERAATMGQAGRVRVLDRFGDAAFSAAGRRVLARAEEVVREKRTKRAARSGE